MKQFIVAKDVFEKLPDYCVGVVVATGFDNHSENAAVAKMLDDEAERFAAEHAADNVRELTNIKACRDAFQVLGMNPNKFMCSIEALTKRVQKSGALPHINPVVDLGNAFSLRYQLPMGAHDIEKAEGDIEIRFSTPEDHFLPMGETELEVMPEGELVYVSGHTVKTRRWIWRQSDDGKITEETSHVFFPIDGFGGVNRDDVLKARDELADLLAREFNCDIKIGFVDISANSMEI
jgi:DNA/RNA-binding domain of Phe-tRNA-synthetase-like protein